MLAETRLKNIILAGIFLIPFIGLIVSSSFYFPYITPKNLAFRLIILVIAALFSIVIYKGKKYRPSFGTIGWSFLIFIIILLLADVFGKYSPKSFFSNFERMEGFFTLLLLFFYFTILTGVMKTERLWQNLLNISLASSVIMAIYALVEKSTGVDRLAAQLGNSTYLAAFMLFNIFFALFLIIRQLDKKEGDKGSKWLIIGTYVVIAALDFYIFYHTGTRGALLGLMTGILFVSILFAFFEKHNRKLKYAGYIILIAIIIFSVSLFSIRDSDFVKSSPLLSRFAALIAAPADFNQYVSTEGRARFAIWKIALAGVKERPILGWGQENFNYIFNEHYNPEIYDQEQWFDRAHNVFFDWLVSGGILGLLSYLSMFVLAVYVLWRKKREDLTHHFSFADKTVLTALLIAYFIHNFFVFDSITSYILFFTVLAYISLHEKPISFSKFNLLKSEGTQALGSTVFSLAMIVGLYYLVISPYISSTDLIKAMTYQNTALSNRVALNPDQRNALFPQALDYFKKAEAHGITGRAEVNEQLLQAGATVLTIQGVNPDVQKAYADEIDSEMKKQLAETPDDARYFLFYATYLSNIGRTEESFPYFEKAIELSPNKQSILVSKGLAYINVKNFSEGLPILRKAWELEEKNGEARIYYVVGLIYAGDNKTAEGILAAIKDTDQGTDIRIMKAYYDTNQSNKVNELLAIKLQIADKLFAEGDKEGAIREIEDVISINPAYKTQGEAKIAQIEASE